LKGSLQGGSKEALENTFSDGGDLRKKEKNEEK